MTIDQLKSYCNRKGYILELTLIASKPELLSAINKDVAQAVLGCVKPEIKLIKKEAKGEAKNERGSKS